MLISCFVSIVAPTWFLSINLWVTQNESGDQYQICTWRSI